MNQLGKPTATPTMRWVFQCFLSHLRSSAADCQLDPRASRDSSVSRCPLPKILFIGLIDLRNVGSICSEVKLLRR